VLGVRLLGHAEALVFRQLEDGLLVLLPQHEISDLVPCIRVELANS
jgi:hypothetical protein